MKELKIFENRITKGNDCRKINKELIKRLKKSLGIVSHKKHIK